MSKNGLEPDPNNALTWPENSPMVAMDVDLRKLNRRLDVDVPLLARLLDAELGLHRPSLFVKMVHPKNIPRQNGQHAFNGPELFLKEASDELRGLLTTPDEYIKIRVQQRRGLGHPDNVKNTNKTFLHETRHYIGAVRGESLTRAEKDQQERKYRKIIIGGSAVLGAAGLSIAAVATDLNLAEAGILEACFVGVAGSSSWMFEPMIQYKYDPDEKAAREFAENPPFEDAYYIFSSR